MSLPTVSVIIPAYNASKTITPTIESVLAQSHPAHEIIVVDDGSKDDTVSIAESFPPPVRVIRKPNGGPASARNVGARAAKGEWLAFLDADDRFLPEKLEFQLQLADDPKTAIIHGHATDSGFSIPDELDFDSLWERNTIVNSSVLMRRTVFDSMGGFDETRELISAEDYNMWLRVAAAGWRIRCCQKRVVEYARGVGISSQLDRFVNAQAWNIQAIATHVGLAPEEVRTRIARLFRDAGASAIFNRDMSAARQFYRRSRNTEDSLRARLRLAISYLPPALLDARRHLMSKLGPRSRRNLSSVDSIFVDHDAARVAVRSDERPTLLVVVDAEEEFDWATVPSPSIQVESIKSQRIAQTIFARHGIIPTYAVDYAVASQDKGFKPLRDFMRSGECEIGTQLHPWINPPISEVMNVHNSFVGNLPDGVQFEKLRVLTETIRSNFDCDPILYRAGRYGAGHATIEHLKKLGYRIDTSVRPLYDLQSAGGPDYSRSPTHPYWCDQEQTLLEIPLTVGMLGIGARYGRDVYPWISGPTAQRLRIPAMLSRANILNRTSISPEGTPLSEAKELTQQLLRAQPNSVIVLTYHSTSLEPGNTPYVRNQADLQRLLSWLEDYIEFFLGSCGGVPSTPGRLFNEFKAGPAPNQP